MNNTIVYKNLVFLIKKEKTSKVFCEKTGILYETTKHILKNTEKKKFPLLETLIPVSETYNLTLDSLVYTDLTKK